jgi:chemotaxis protein CheD
MIQTGAAKTIYVVQGEYRVSAEPEEVLSTLLGSCVAVCLWDPVGRVGGMNHFLLPFGPEGAKDGSMRYGVHSVEILVNDLLRHGARRDRLRAKLFGGARMSSRLRDIGTANAAFARDYLRTEDIACIAESLGGTSARRVIFRPTTGQAQQMLVPDAIIEETSAAPRKQDVTLF